jgi:hypothetical protein
MSGDVLADDRIEALRSRLGVPDLRQAADPDQTAEAATQPVRGPLPRRPRALAVALTKRYASPVADPVLHRLAHAITPTVAALVANRLLGQIEPEVRRLTAQVELLQAEVAAMAATDRDALAGSVSRTRRRLDDLSHRLNQLEERLDQP